MSNDKRVIIMENPHQPEKHHKKKSFHEYHESHKEHVPVDLKNKPLLRRYLSYLRTQDDHTQRVHAFTISGGVTAIVILLWLHFAYGFFPFGTEVYDPSMVYEEKVMQSAALSTEKENPFRSFFEEAKSRFKSVTFNPSEVFSDTETYERNADVSGTDAE